jgi:hypothetical protein
MLPSPPPPPPHLSIYHCYHHYQATVIFTILLHAYITIITNWFLYRTYLKTSCLMDLRDFPLDYQRCSVHFSSCEYYCQCSYIEVGNNINVFEKPLLKKVIYFSAFVLATIITLIYNYFGIYQTNTTIYRIC